MQEYNGKPVEYLGDGVYALYGYTGIWLHTNNHANPTDKILIEPSVLEALNIFSKAAPLAFKQWKKEKDSNLKITIDNSVNI